MNLVPLIIISVVVESAVGTFNTLFKAKGKISYKKLGAIILSIAVCMCVPYDLFEAVGMHMAFPYIGPFVTGLVVSRGSGVVNSLIKRMMMTEAQEPKNLESVMGRVEAETGNVKQPPKKVEQSPKKIQPEVGEVTPETTLAEEAGKEA